MKIKFCVAIVCVMLLITSCTNDPKPKWIVNSADSKNATLHDTGHSFVSIFSTKEKKEIQSVGINYIPFSYPFKPGPVKGLLKVSRIAIRDVDLTLTNAQCEVRSFWISKPIQKAAPYAILLPLEEVYTNDFLLEGVRRGLDDNEDFYMLINPLNGAEVLSYTRSYIDAVVPNSKERRYFGFCSRKNNAGVFAKADKLMIGTLTYSNSREVLQQFAIYAKDENTFSLVDPYTPDMNFETNNDTYRLLEEGKRLGLMSLDESSESKFFTGFGMEMRMYVSNSDQPSPIKFMVENDKVNIDKAIFDKSLFRIEEVK